MTTRKFCKVIVRHTAMKEEQVYLCTDRTAYISLYTQDAAILFEDSSKRRYAGTVDYNLHKLLDIEELSGKLAKDGQRYAGIAFTYLWGIKARKSHYRRKYFPALRLF